MFKVFVVAATYQAVCLPFRIRGAVPYYSGHRPPLYKRLHQLLLSDTIGLPDLDLLTVPATELQKLLAESKVSTVDLVERYLAQIENHNHNGTGLKAIISTAPRENVLKLAQKLDDERKTGNLRGPMHGIPITVKSGRSNNIDACRFVGSSSGSAVGVAAGFAPVSIGAETDGSVVQPATRAALYGLKASHGSTEPGGVLPGALSFDSLGGFAKTRADLVEVMSSLMG
ncbi:MAG: hypothetical protein Q9207_003855 [Kuettlingeria erythrocarpa]